MSFRILVVDDSILMRTALKRTIEMADVGVDEILEAGNGQEALDLLAENKADMIFTDLNMPVMSGFDFVQKIKQSQELSGIPVVVITTESSTVRIEDLQDSGVADYLHKPFTPEQFRDVITKNITVGS